MSFPIQRPRRLRQTPGIRALARETSLSPTQLVWPLFFREGIGAPVAVKTMPGVFQLPTSTAAQVAKDAKDRGIGGVLLFGLPARKDATGSSALDPNGPVPNVVRAMKDAVPELVVMTDVCVDEYTDHGHCGLVKRTGATFEVDNDATLSILANMAVVHAQAGTDVVAPSDMMDGRIASIRQALDSAGKINTVILSYAVKYASCFYGPFRDAADCAPQFGDRSSYQMDPSNAREALREIALDEAEGADMVMVKPALPYLDILARVRNATTLPLGAYAVSGEYAMIEAAALSGMIDRKRAVLESLTAMRRAGADFVLTYHALQAAEWLDA